MFLEKAELIIHTADFYRSDHTWSSTEFYYPHNILYYVTHGNALLVLADETIPLKAGHIYLLSGLAFRETICKDTLEHYYIHFQAKTPYYDNVSELYGHPKALPVSESSQLIHHFKEIMKNYTQDNIYGKYISVGTLKIILAPFFQQVEAPKKEVLRFIDLLTYIDDHIHEKILITHLAEFMCLETTYFTHLFTEAFGLSPKKYIIKKRLERAQLLLTQTNLTMRHIANQLGFDNDMYFARLFRDKIGITPSDYRKLSYKKKHME